MWNAVFVALLTVPYLPFSRAQRQEIKIGAFFYGYETNIEKSFALAIQEVNKNFDNNFFFIPIIRKLNEEGGSYALQKEACNLLANGASAIFGPSSRGDSDIVAHLCARTGIPHILFDMANEADTSHLNHRALTVNVFPNQLILSKAYADIVNNFGWRKFTILYYHIDENAPAHLQDLLQLRDVHKELIRVRKFKKKDDFRLLWKNINGERRVVLDCPPDVLVEVLNAAMQFNMMSELNHMFLTNLDTHTSNRGDLKNNNKIMSNITAARVMMDKDQTEKSSFQWSSELITDLIHDAVLLFGSAVLNATFHTPIVLPEVSCNFVQQSSPNAWALGNYITSVMKMNSGAYKHHLRSRNFQLNDDGQRINFNIEIYKPLKNFSTAYLDTKGHISPVIRLAETEDKIVYRVATRLGPPYFTENATAKSLNITGNGLYQGYAAELIQAIAEEMGFEYIFVPVKDNEYGKENKETKQWNGIIGELINNDAHMGICDLTITQARKHVVDFTVPFMQLGISILGYKTPSETKSALAFLEPFVVDVWVYVSIAIFVMIFLLVLVARISKDEWENPHPCCKETEVLENKWHFKNAFWLTLGSIMTAGSDILPRSFPMRTLNSMWWIFAIIIANSYTANLAAFLTNSKIQGSIKDIKDLSEQTSVAFGTILGASTYNFFAESNETTYRLAFNIMNSQDPSAYTKNNDEGVQRVLKNAGSYMFLMETTTIEYNVARNPLLRNVGEKFGEKHYAIAVPFGADYRSNLSVAILKLSESGSLFMLKKKWWNGPNASVERASENEDTSTQEMTLEGVRGIFYTLAIGIVLAILIGLSEFALHAQSIALEEQISFNQSFKTELKFMLNIWNNKKPIRATPATSIRTSSPISFGKAEQKF